MLLSTSAFYWWPHLNVDWSIPDAKHINFLLVVLSILIGLYLMLCFLESVGVAGWLIGLYTRCSVSWKV